MAGFSLLREDGIGEVEQWTISSLTLAVGDLLEMDVGATAATVADSATEHWQRKGVCMEAATSSDTTVLVKIVNPKQVWKCEVANTVNTSHNGDRMVLTDRNTVNNTGTDSTAEEAVVIQTGASGTEGLFRFFDSTGINPDAA